MLHQHTLDQLRSLRLDGMVHALADQATSATASALAYRLSNASSQPMKSSFPVRPEHLVGEGSDVAAVVTEAQRLAERFLALRSVSIPEIPVEWESSSPPGSLMGTARMKTRVQRFTLMLDLYGTRPRLRCISPVGRVYPDARQGEIIASAWRLGARIGAIHEMETGSYDLTVEEDVLLSDPSHDGTRLQAVLRRVVDQADRLEQEFLPGLDQPLAAFRDELEQEIVDGR